MQPLWPHPEALWIVHVQPLQPSVRLLRLPEGLRKVLPVLQKLVYNWSCNPSSSVRRVHQGACWGGSGWHRHPLGLGAWRHLPPLTLPRHVCASIVIGVHGRMCYDTGVESELQTSQRDSMCWDSPWTL